MPTYDYRCESCEHRFELTLEQLADTCFVERGLVRVSPRA